MWMSLTKILKSWHMSLGFINKMGDQVRTLQNLIVTHSRVESYWKLYRGITMTQVKICILHREISAPWSDVCQIHQAFSFLIRPSCKTSDVSVNSKMQSNLQSFSLSDPISYRPWLRSRRFWIDSVDIFYCSLGFNIKI